MTVQWAMFVSNSFDNSMPYKYRFSALSMMVRIKCVPDVCPLPDFELSNRSLNLSWMYRMRASNSAYTLKKKPCSGFYLISIFRF